MLLPNKNRQTTNIDREILPAFVHEADGLLHGIRSGILANARESRSIGELESSLHKVRSLKTAAAMFELREIDRAAESLELHFTSLFEANEPLSDTTARSLLDLLAQIEASIMKIRMKSDDFSLDISEFIEESFDNLQVRAFSVENREPPEIESVEILSEEHGFEIDAEMLEIFAMEADDLLKNIGNSLEALAKNPNDRDALWEIRRNAHTFKGAAGIIGLKKPSELAHRVEDLLDHLSENEFEPNPRIYELLRSATDCLKSLTSGDLSPQLAEKISQVYEDFNELLLALANGTLNAPANPTVPPQKQVALNVIPAASAPVHEESEIKTPSIRAQPRSIVRVSLSRLDDLVRIVRDLVVSRSVFEQRLFDFEQQIEELHNSTRRLRSTSSKLEIDFEASLLGGSNPTFASGNNSRQITGDRSMTDDVELFDDLEFDRYTDFHQSTRELSETTSDTFAINTALDVLRGNFESLFGHQRHLIEEMQEKLMSIRMVEFGTLFPRLQRAVRVTCEEENKKAEISIENPSLEVDTQVLDSLIEPLIHLLRNAVVHGIESADTRRLLGKPEAGQIHLQLINEETHIVMTVSDDGRGIAASTLREKAVSTGVITRKTADSMTEEQVLDLIFMPGLTTAETLSLSAGRGVGMSIVKESIETQQGTIFFESVPQQGTSFTVRMPLSLAVTNVLLVKVNRLTYAVPLKMIKHIGEMSAADSRRTDGETIFELGAGKYSLTRLDEYLGMPSFLDPNRENVTVLLIEIAGKSLALEVDEIVKTEEIVIKSLGKPLNELKGLLGAAILGSGDLVPILDLPILLKNKTLDANREAIVAPEPITVLVVDDSPSVRYMTSKVITDAGWVVVTAKDGIEALESLQAARKLPHLILTDVEMPRMDGYELVASLKRNETFREIPVVFITSRAGEKHRDKASELGVSDYLAKPFEDAELIGTVKRLAQL